MAKKKKESCVKQVLITEADKQILTTAAVDAFPKEAYGWLLGKREGDIVTVHRVFPIVGVEREEDGVVMPCEHGDLMETFLGAQKVGEFHSHPCWTGLPSKTDLETMTTGVECIIEVWQRKAGQSDGMRKVKKDHVSWLTNIRVFDRKGREIGSAK